MSGTRADAAGNSFKRVMAEYHEELKPLLERALRFHDSLPEPVRRAVAHAPLAVDPLRVRLDWLANARRGVTPEDYATALSRALSDAARQVEAQRWG